MNMTSATISMEHQRANLPSVPATQPAREHPSHLVELTGNGTPPSSRKNRRALFKRIALAALMVVAAIGAGRFACDWWTVGRFMESTDDAYVGGDVTVIAPKVAGFIEQVAVTDNQRVEAGELLVKLDDRDYRAALARAEAAADAQ